MHVCRRKARYLLDDCSDALVKLKMAFRPSAHPVELTQEQTVASYQAITLTAGTGTTHAGPFHTGEVGLDGSGATPSAAWMTMGAGLLEEMEGNLNRWVALEPACQDGSMVRGEGAGDDAAAASSLLAPPSSPFLRRGSSLGGVEEGGSAMKGSLASEASISLTPSRGGNAVGGGMAVGEGSMLLSPALGQPSLDDPLMEGMGQSVEEGPAELEFEFSQELLQTASQQQQQHPYSSQESWHPLNQSLMEVEVARRHAEPVAVDRIVGDQDGMDASMSKMGPGPDASVSVEGVDAQELGAGEAGETPFSPPGAVDWSSMEQAGMGEQSFMQPGAGDVSLLAGLDAEPGLPADVGGAGSPAPGDRRRLKRRAAANAAMGASAAMGGAAMPLAKRRRQRRMFGAGVLRNPAVDDCIELEGGVGTGLGRRLEAADPATLTAAVHEASGADAAAFDIDRSSLFGMAPLCSIEAEVQPDLSAVSLLGAVTGDTPVEEEQEVEVGRRRMSGTDVFDGPAGMTPATPLDMPSLDAEPLLCEDGMEGPPAHGEEVSFFESVMPSQIQETEEQRGLDLNQNETLVEEEGTTASSDQLTRRFAADLHQKFLMSPDNSIGFESDLLSAPSISKRKAAASFYQVLVLASRRGLDVEQTTPRGEIRLRALPGLEAFV